jgi:hypothetical protein
MQMMTAKPWSFGEGLITIVPRGRREDPDMVMSVGQVPMPSPAGLFKELPAEASYMATLSQRISGELASRQRDDVARSNVLMHVAGRRGLRALCRRHRRLGDGARQWLSATSSRSCRSSCIDGRARTASRTSRALVENGIFQSFVVKDSWAVTTVVNFPQAMIVDVFFIVGSLEDFEALQTQIEKFARQIGATFMRVYGRPGFEYLIDRRNWGARAGLAQSLTRRTYRAFTR